MRDIAKPTTRKLIPCGESAERDRNNFGIIRLALALAVVWSHSFALHLGSEDGEWVSRVLDGKYNAGTLAVMGFFVISGLLITQSWERSSSARSYFAKRVRRIFPGYIVATTLCAFVVAPMFGGEFPNPIKTLGLNLLLQGYIPAAFPRNAFPGPVNGSLWSIPFEFWCYIGVAAGASIALKRPRYLIGLTLVLMAGHIVINAVKVDFGIIETIFGLPLFWTIVGPSFLLGMLAYRFPIPRSPFILVGLIVLAIVSCQFKGIHTFVVPPALAYAVLYASFSERVSFHPKADLSYGTYLYAFPIQQMLQATTNLTMPEFIAASMALSLIAGALSWFLVERPFQRVKRRQPTTALAW